jgi:hypothetical protein
MIMEIKSSEIFCKRGLVKRLLNIEESTPKPQIRQILAVNPPELQILFIIKSNPQRGWELMPQNPLGFEELVNQKEVLIARRIPPGR